MELLFLITFIISAHAHVCVCVRAHACICVCVHAYNSEDNLWESVLSLHHGGSKDRIRVVRFSGNHQLSYLLTVYFIYFCLVFACWGILCVCVVCHWFDLLLCDTQRQASHGGEPCPSCKRQHKEWTLHTACSMNYSDWGQFTQHNPLWTVNAGTECVFPWKQL